MHRYALAQYLQRARAPNATPKPVDEVVQNGIYLDDSLNEQTQTSIQIFRSRNRPLPTLASDSGLHEWASSTTRYPPPTTTHSNEVNGDTVGRATSNNRTGFPTQTVGRAHDGATMSSHSGMVNESGTGMNITDFFSSEVFNLVLHNPTTAHRFLRFCQNRACGEHMEFLQKVGFPFKTLTLSGVSLK